MKSKLVIILSLLIIEVHSFAATKTTQGWKAGIAREIITPEQSVWMGGYSSRTDPADGKLHDLWAKALFLEDASGNQAILITVDLLAFSRFVSDRIRDGLRNHLGLSRADIILNCSHTHSGPVVSRALTDIYTLDDMEKQKIDLYTDKLVQKIVDLGTRARKNMKPVTIFSGNGVVRFQVNRRNNKEAEIASLQELKGPNDYAVPVLKIEDSKGHIKAIAFGYACHATTLNEYQWSGDYPGLEMKNINI